MNRDAREVDRMMERRVLDERSVLLPARPATESQLRHRSDSLADQMYGAMRCAVPLLVAAGLGLAGFAACGGKQQTEPEQGGAAGADGRGGTGSECNCGALEECWNDSLCVAKLVPITGGYAIDATEVTRSQYAAWLATNPSATGQDPICVWNSNLLPAGNVSFACDWPPESNGNHPVACVDWCDAFAYCKSVGKRLCGKIGGGAVEFANAIDPQSQWLHACTSGGAYNHPYGWTYAPENCNVGESGLHETVPVASLAGCQSPVPGYEGVFDLSGNVYEWEDSCDDGGVTERICRIRGGDFLSYAGANQCGFDAESGFRNRTGGTGFRCCSL